LNIKYSYDYIIKYSIFIYALIAIYLSTTTPLIPGEAKILFENNYTISHYIATLFYSIFNSFFGLRVGFVSISIIDIYLLYIIIRDRMRDEEEVLFTLFLFMVLPGTIASSVLVSDSPIAILFTLLFIISHQKRFKLISYISLSILLFTNTASFSLYIAIFLYAFSKRDNTLSIISMVLFIISIVINQYSIAGKPEGHFLELLGIYAGVFSPLLFIYYFYALYRSLLEGRRDILWYISFSALAISMLLSIRQKIHITDFSPYLIIGIPIAVEVFLRSLKVRMRRFQSNYRRFAFIVISTLILSSSILILNRPIYYLSGKSRRVFISEIYRVYEKAKSLKSLGAKCYNSSEIPSRYKNVMRFYGINRCSL